jgi:hypothetical protein
MQYSLIYQMTRITKDRGALAHDDRLDALAMAVAYWVESMSKDIEEAKEEAKELALNDELETFMENALHRPSNPRNYLSSSMR